MLNHYFYFLFSFESPVFLSFRRLKLETESPMNTLSMIRFPKKKNAIKKELMYLFAFLTGLSPYPAIFMAG